MEKILEIENEGDCIEVHVGNTRILNEYSAGITEAIWKNLPEEDISQFANFILEMAAEFVVISDDPEEVMKTFENKVRQYAGFVKKYSAKTNRNKIVC